jgi:hypothetical protein
MLKIILGAAMGMAVPLAAALADDARPLSGDGLRTAVAGKTVHLETPIGTLPINFGSDGSMSAKAGAVASYTGSASDNGSWWVTGEKLCSRWNSWLKGKTHCFTLQQDGRQVTWRSTDGMTGVATISR